MLAALLAGALISGADPATFGRSPERDASVLRGASIQLGLE
ncbi:MAG: hypothetical protein QOJ10_936 [Chloroflexota bacterium]|jgi:hypothetical protein|nr:hypothetical protein [Chloroflexota bacterium]